MFGLFSKKNKNKDGSERNKLSSKKNKNKDGSERNKLSSDVVELLRKIELSREYKKHKIDIFFDTEKRQGEYDEMNEYYVVRAYIKGFSVSDVEEYVFDEDEVEFVEAADKKSYNYILHTIYGLRSGKYPWLPIDDYIVRDDEYVAYQISKEEVSAVREYASPREVLELFFEVLEECRFLIDSRISEEQKESFVSGQPGYDELLEED